MSKVTPTNAGENVYKKREQDSIPAPLDYSSDSEFAAGPVKPMEKGSGKRRNTKSKRESIRPAKKRKVVWSDSEDEEWMTSFDSSVNATNKSQINGKHTIKNPLAKYFDAVEIDHGSEDDADDEMQIEDDIDIDEDRQSGEDEDPAHIPKTMAAFLPVINTRRINIPPQTAVKDVEQTSHTEDDSSHTESDSEPPFPSTTSIKKADSSHTEDDSDIELEIEKGDYFSQNRNESDKEMDSPQINPRPGFQSPESSVNEPFFLDPGNNIKIPSTINIFLRDYQRNGVQFFYERYRAGRGGLLGDDMGLVIYLFSSFRSFYNIHFSPFLG
ncbi:rad26-like snf2 family dna-dependent atpase [Lentinula edodes]|nr:rad26-like snf2 family dna-dependent atpase [Lentinula edodes]